MEEIRTMTVDELIRSFVAISYLQEQRIFKFSDIYKYIEKCYQSRDEDYRINVFFPNLIEEVEEVIDYMRATGILSYVYSNGDNGMYRIENKVDYMGLVQRDKEYVKDMVKVFLCINGGNSMPVTLIPTKTNIKK